MAYVFYNLPADSSDLETFQWYHVARVAHVARGGPVASSFLPAPELVLQGTRRPWYEPALMRAPVLRGLARKVPTPAWCLPGFIGWRRAASLLSVPSLCFAMVWLLALVWP